MLKVFQPAATSSSSSSSATHSAPPQWFEYWRYDSSARVILHANSSVVNGFDETKSDLVNYQGATAQYLNLNSGLIKTSTYDPVSGRVSGELIQQGQLGLPIILRQYEYTACCLASSSSSSRSSSSGSSSTAFSVPCVFFLAKLIEYPDDGTLGSSSSSSSSGPASGTANGNTRQIITTYAYTFWPGTCAIHQKTTAWPVIRTSQNGSGVAAQMLEYFDIYGELIWKMDERGFITGMTYDIPTGALTQRIDDVNTAVVSAPAGWSTPSGGGLHLITDFQFDSQGRETQSLGPRHTIDLSGIATSIRRASYTVYQDATFQTWQGQGYATGASSSSSSSRSSSSGSSSSQTANYNYFLVNPVSITITRADGEVTDQIQAVRFAARGSSSSSSSVGSTASAPVVTAGALSAADSFPQSSYCRWTTTQYTDCCFAGSQRVYKLIPTSGIGANGTNYDETDFGYDVMKRKNREVTPGGTITRTVFDAPGRPIATWVGTNDTGATSSNPAGSGAPNNMVQITGLVYDSGLAGGDSNVTQRTDFVDATGLNDRVTTFLYDFRNRQTDTDGEINLYAKQYFDNLDRIFKKERYHTTLAGNLIMRGTMSWDDRAGRGARAVPFQATKYAVDPTTGIVGNALTDNTWYDAANNIVKSLPAGSQLFTKTTFDSLGRKTVEYTGYGTDDSYPAIFSVANNTILEQQDIAFDAASNAIQVAVRKRYHNAPAAQVGALGDPSTTPNARVAYSAVYPDSLGRAVATADYGTNGGASLMRSSTIPARSDTCLVSSVQFDVAGNRGSTTDPASTVTCFGYDAVPRTVSQIMNCVTASSSSSSSSSSGGGCAPSLDTNVTILTAYNADGNVASVTAINPLTNNQVTQYVYGSTLATSAIASSLLKSAEILPDSVSGIDQITWTYNRQGQKTTLTDQNGTVHSYNYDLLGRETDDRITTVGTGIDNAVLRISKTYEVREMLAGIASYDNATVGAGNVVNDVRFAYNSFQQLTADYQSHSGAVNVATTPSTQYAYADASANTVRPVSMTYPNGRVLSDKYGTPGDINDSASRVASLIDNDGVTHLADYSYLGGAMPSPRLSPRERRVGGEGASFPTLSSTFNRDTVVQVDSPQPGIQYTLVGIQGGNDPVTGDIYRGLELFGRVKDLIWAPTGSSSSSSSSSAAGANLVRIQHTYDRMGNRLSRRDLVAGAAGVGLDELYGYDFIHRLTSLDRGTLNSTGSAITIKDFAQCWALDPAANWSVFRQDDTGGGIWDLVQQRSANSVNEITGITNTVGSAWVQPKYDAAGNMSTVPQPANPTVAYTCSYDAWNRLAQVVDAPTGNVVARYAHDGAKRRTVKKTYTGGVLSETRHFFYTEPARWQVVEERVGTSTTAERQFVWGLRYIGDLVLRDRDATGTGALNEHLYALQDPNWNVVAIADSDAVVQERYSYDAYGMIILMTAGFAIRNGSLFAWETLYAGYCIDPETGFAVARHRLLRFSLGWLGRDPMGLGAGPMNLYLYSASNPVTYRDASGLVVEICCRIAHVPLAKRLGYDHCWIRTGTKVIGRGAVKGACCEGKPLSLNCLIDQSDITIADNVPRECVPVDEWSERGLGLPFQKYSYCGTVSSCDEDCIDAALQIGADCGRWFWPFNDCNTTIQDILGKCCNRSWPEECFDHSGELASY
jgi:RHS repeat-associated protein